MNSNPILVNLLDQLRLAILATEFSRTDLVSAMENLLLWLNRSENNTDSNCKQIDYFISTEIISEKYFKKLPEDIQNILFDMGATLHDTHTSPEIAENFESTPAQLLVRVQNL
jgi:hypothetical protein